MIARADTNVAPIVIGGPTASGKSALALAIAERVGGEIVCADSRQLYEGMRVASAAPDDVDRARAPHHLYESVAPDGPAMTAGAWSALCDDVVTAIQGRGHVPIIVGGTGLYLRAWRIGLVEASDPVVRARIDAEAAADLAAVYVRLRDVDLDAADAIEPTDRMRIVRALEIFEVSGRPRGAMNPLVQPPRPIAKDATWLLVDAPLPDLEPRMRARAERMFGWRGAPPLDPPPDPTTERARGPIVDEAVALARRLPSGDRLLATIGVAEALQVASGLDIATAILWTTTRTRQFGRRQKTWFKKEPWWRSIDGRTLVHAASLASAADGVLTQRA